MVEKRRQRPEPLATPRAFVRCRVRRLVGLVRLPPELHRADNVAHPIVESSPITKHLSFLMRFAFPHDVVVYHFINPSGYLM